MTNRTNRKALILVLAGFSLVASLAKGDGIGQRRKRQADPVAQNIVPNQKLRWASDQAGWNGYAAILKQAVSQRKQVALELYIDRSEESQKSMAETSRDPGLVKTLWSYDAESKRFENESLRDLGVQKELEFFVVIRANARAEGRRLAEYYGTSRYPSMILINPEWFKIPDESGPESSGPGSSGRSHLPEVVSRLEGYWSAPALTGALECTLNDARDYPSMMAGYRSSRALEAIGRLAEIAVHRGDKAAARQYLDEGLAQDPENERGSLIKALYLVGELVSEEGDFETARKYFELAAKTCRDNEVAAAVQVDLAVNEVAQGRWQAGAKRLQSAMNAEGFPAEYRKRAAGLLDRLNQSARETGDTSGDDVDGR